MDAGMSTVPAGYPQQAIHERTPMVFIELQLRPSPPPGAMPYWWGNHDLKFRFHGETVWEGHVECAAYSSAGARVVERPGFGWVVILELAHDKARDALAKLGLPNFVEGVSS